MASTSATNEPEIQTPRISTVSRSLPTASTKSRQTSSKGCQSDACDVSAAADIAMHSTDDCAARMSPWRLVTTFL